MLLKFTRHLLLLEVHGCTLLTAASALPHRSGTSLALRASVDARDRSSGDTFEEFWLLRACYPHRSDYDARSTVSVEEAIRYGEQLLRLMHLQDRWGGFRQRHRSA
jgi:hypothetical protein